MQLSNNKQSYSNLNTLNHENQEENFTTGEKLRNRKYHIGPAKNSEAVKYLLENELATTHSPDKNYVTLADDNHRIAFNKYMKDKGKFPRTDDEVDPETAVQETPIQDKKIGLQIDNVSTRPPEGLGAVKNQEHYDEDVIGRLIPRNNSSPIKSSKFPKSGGNSFIRFW